MGKIAENDKALGHLNIEHDKIYQPQKQIQGNMGALSSAGKEKALRGRYVDDLKTSEEKLKELAPEEARLKLEMRALEQEIETKLKSVSS